MRIYNTTSRDRDDTTDRCMIHDCVRAFDRMCIWNNYVSIGYEGDDQTDERLAIEAEKVRLQHVEMDRFAL